MGGNRKFTDEEIIEMRNMRRNTPVAMIAVAYNASLSTVHDILRGKSYKNVGGPTQQKGYRVRWARLCLP